MQVQGVGGRIGALSAQGPDIQVQGRTWARLLWALASYIDNAKAEGMEQGAEGGKGQSGDVSHSLWSVLELNMSSSLLAKSLVLAVLCALGCSSLDTSHGWLVFIL